MVSWTEARRVILVAVALTLLLPGCESHLERNDLEREQRQLQEQKELLQKALQKEIAGKPELTEQEKARVGPIAIELRRVENKIADVQSRLRELE